MNRTIIITIAIISWLTFSCNKILDEKSDRSLSTPNSISSLQEMLDYTYLMNIGASWGEGAADNLYILDTKLDQLGKLTTDAYKWQPIAYDGSMGDWANLYNTINVTNVVIEEIKKIIPKASTLNSWNNVLGSALFFRSQSYLNGAFIYCRGFDSSNADKNWGMVLRLSSDFNKPSVRVSLLQTYNQIINDLKKAVLLLPLHSINIYRPSKGAAYGLLSRTYLSAHNYKEAKLYADSCLNLNNKLLDYNSLDVSLLRQFDVENPEIIFNRYVSSYTLASASPKTVKVDTTLYNMYEDNDLRKYAFFRSSAPGQMFKGSYSGTYTKIFAGVATDELYLTRAECYARSGDYDKALEDLNALLIKRWKKDTYQPYLNGKGINVLNLILTERRKELLFRCLRWMDIKRLNLEGYNIVLKRVIKGEEFILEPNSKAFAIPIPAEVVSVFGVPQNEY